MDARHRWIATARLLVARLERLSADSFWAHQASGLRGSLLMTLEEAGADGESEAEEDRLAALLGRGFAILNRAARETHAPAFRAGRGGSGDGEPALTSKTSSSPSQVSERD